VREFKGKASRPTDVSGNRATLRALGFGISAPSSSHLFMKETPALQVCPSLASIQETPRETKSENYY
jgi:hypothetical protein